MIENSIKNMNFKDSNYQFFTVWISASYSKSGLNA